MEYSEPSATAAEETKAAGCGENKKLKVMVAVDASDGSMYALSWALDNLFTGASGGAAGEQVGTVIVLHAQPPFHGAFYPAGQAVYAPDVAVIDSVKKSQERNSASILSKALQICKDKLVKVETIVMEGDPKDIICQAAEKMQVDILVVGSRGLGMIKRALLGSVSDYIAHHARCPVLIAKPPKTDASPKTDK